MKKGDGQQAEKERELDFLPPVTRQLLEILFISYSL
jgi:hypothetical protein